MKNKSVQKKRAPFNKGKILVAGEFYDKSFRKDIIIAFIVSVLSCGISYLCGFIPRLTETQTTFQPSPLVRAFEPVQQSVQEIRQELEIVEKRVFKSDIEAYIFEVFGDDYDDAMKILSCENKSLDPKAVNVNRNGTIDRGIFQLNSAYWGEEENFDYKININKAYKIFKKQGWSPWTCSYKVGVKSYWQ